MVAYRRRPRQRVAKDRAPRLRVHKAEKRADAACARITGRGGLRCKFPLVWDQQAECRTPQVGYTSNIPVYHLQDDVHVLARAEQELCLSITLLGLHLTRAIARYRSAWFNRI